MTTFTKLVSIVKGIAVKVDKDAKRKARTEDKKIKPSNYNLICAQVPADLCFFHFKTEEASKGEWRAFKSDTCCHELVSKSVVNEILKGIIEGMGLDYKRENATALQVLKNKREVDPLRFDTPNKLLLCDKKVIDYEQQKVREFDPSIDFFTKREERHLVEVDPYSAMIIENILMNVVIPQEGTIKTYQHPLEDSADFDYKFQRWAFHQWLVNAAWCFMEDRTCLALIGYPNAAKTLVTALWESMFPNSSGAMLLSAIGDNGNLNSIYNRRYAIQNECNGGYFTPISCDKFKELQSQIVKMPVRLLYQNPFDAQINLMMLIAANQLPALSETFENASLYKRFLILFCPNQFNKCVELQSLMMSPEFCDQVLSYLLSYSPAPICKTCMTEQEFWTRSEELYQWSSHPMERILNKLYVRDYTNIAGCDTDVVYQNVTQEMIRQELKIPKSVTEQINKAVARMGGTLRRNKKEGDAFQGISRLRPEITAHSRPSTPKLEISEEEMKAISDKEIDDLLASFK